MNMYNVALEIGCLECYFIALMWMYGFQFILDSPYDYLATESIVFYEEVCKEQERFGEM